MAKTLFSHEDIDSTTDVELELLPEEAELADAAAVAFEDIAVLEDDAAAVAAGVAAADDAQELLDVVAPDAATGEEAPAPQPIEQVSEIAAEAIALAFRAVARQVGAPTELFIRANSFESFGDTASSRFGQYASEGIGDFLKDLYKRVKAVLDNLWIKAMKFWDKHISSLGRARKALESMKSKVSESTGKLKGEAYFDEAPSSLVAAFAGKDDISTKVVAEYIKTHVAATLSAEVLYGKSSAIVSAIAAIKVNGKGGAGFRGLKVELEKELSEDGTYVAHGSNASTPAYLVGGETYKITVKAEDEGGIDFEIETETLDDTESKLGISVPAKADLTKLLADTIAVIKATEKLRDEAKKASDNKNKVMQALGKTVEELAAKTNAPKDVVKEARYALRFANKYFGKVPTLTAKVSASNIRLAKAVAGYCAFCVKKYK